MVNTGLNNDEIKRIHKVFDQHSEVEKVILYGSRAKGTFKPASDIDLTVIGENLTLTVQQKIECELDDLMLPYKFDISLFTKIDSLELLDHIKRVGILFYSR